ncbi:MULTISPECIES: adenylyl-sulfate kinase [Arthrobacter]|uniref:Adenylyl-sulfate kinase n=1 Tax=Arthrobacter terricola TaxID=2547396 RepID=A0A4R5K6N4_9MICC|nr:MULTISPECIES: adenylyl-sulfate kinase [Arthrobacter]MBT8163809.1 adenylyl-sulfate kinase [Arthrobacter sp. GN70]TDF86886.1 adenylyl-sulfate kinase [Arthrobacter terricola]
MAPDVQSVFLNGTVGSGKTTTGEALHQLLIEDGLSSAMLDLDQLRRVWPAPSTDRFNHELELRNLHAVAGNYREVGVRRFILAGVIERADEVDRYHEALGGGELDVVRLDPLLEIVHTRLRNRHQPDSPELTWHLNRSAELGQILDQAQVDTHVIPLRSETPREVAQVIRTLIGW